MIEPPVLPHACAELVRAFDDSRVPIEYLPKFREYGISLKAGSAMQQIHPCPFCGTKLPGDLRHEYFERLHALGIEVEDPALPEQMKSDAWWRADDADRDTSG